MSQAFSFAVAALPWLPMAAAVLLLGIPKKNEPALKATAVGACVLNAAVVLALLVSLDPRSGQPQFVFRADWIVSLGITYASGIDGISAVMLLLHALVSTAGAFVAVEPKPRLKEYLIFYLTLVGGIYGVFTSLDLFFLYLFYEMTLIPLFPMIGIWGGKNKEYGAMKLTLFITAGAVLALFGLLLLYAHSGARTFNLADLEILLKENPLGPEPQKLIALLCLAGFGVIASLWPLHSWSPIGYAAAPTSVSMLHAGVLKKMGPYLMIRTAVMLAPEGTRFWAPYLAVLAVIGILYAGYAAMKQTDLKFMVGFSSVSHMGYVLLGIAALHPAAMAGAVLLMFSHGVMAACAFALIGFLYTQTHTRGLGDFGGLARKTPFFATAFVMTSLASLGLPGFANFAAELLVFIGAWRTYPAIVALAVFGILITAVYLLRAVQQLCYGPENPRWPDLKDFISSREKFPIILLLAALILFGLWPWGILRWIEPVLGRILL